MVLRVAFEDFPAAVRRVCSVIDVYVHADNSGTVISAAHPTDNRRVETITNITADEAKAKLTQAGLMAHNGRWLTQESELPSESAEFSVGAVAYLSGDSTPGVWVEAFPDAVAPGMVIKALYDEFMSTGEVRDISFDQFVELAKPTVVTLNYDELLAFRLRRLALCGDLGESL